MSTAGQPVPIDEWPDYEDNEEDAPDDMHDDGEDE